MVKANNHEEKIIRAQVVRKFHEELVRRYRLEAIREACPSLNGDLRAFTQDDIDRARDMFITAIYPDAEDREEMEKSFDSLIRLLKSPRKLTHIIPTLPVIVLKYGAHFPAALRIGLNSVIAFNLSRRLENAMVASVRKMLAERGETVNEKFRLSDEDYRKAVAGVPHEDGRKMIQVAFWVLSAGKRSNIAETAWRILGDVQSALTRSDEAAKAAGAPPLYADDVRAIDYGKRTLQKIMDTLDTYTVEKIGRMVHISKAVELEYLERMLGKTSECRQPVFQNS